MELRKLKEGFEELSYTSDSLGQALKKVADRLRNQIFVKKEKEVGIIDLYKSYKNFDEFESSLMNMKLRELKYEDIVGRENKKTCYF